MHIRTRATELAIAMSLALLGTPVAGQTVETVRYGNVVHFYSLDRTTGSAVSNFIWVMGDVLPPSHSDRLTKLLHATEFTVNCKDRELSLILPDITGRLFQQNAPAGLTIDSPGWQVQFRLSNDAAWVWNGEVRQGAVDFFIWTDSTSVRHFVDEAVDAVGLRIRLSHPEVSEAQTDLEFDIDGFAQAVAACRRLSPELQ